MDNGSNFALSTILLYTNYTNYNHSEFNHFILTSIIKKDTYLHKVKVYLIWARPVLEKVYSRQSYAL